MGLKWEDGDVFGSIGFVVYEEEFDVMDVVDEEGFVVGGYYVVGFFVGVIVDLESIVIV